MLFTLLKELVDRFIEFLLKMSKGESPEAKLTSVLKSTVFLISVLVFAVLSLIAENLNMRTQLADYKSVSAKLGVLLKPQSVAGAAEEIGKLSASINDSNNKLRHENTKLLEQNVALTHENYWIQVVLNRTLQESKLLRENNLILMQACRVSFPNKL